MSKVCLLDIQFSIIQTVVTVSKLAFVNLRKTDQGPRAFRELSKLLNFLSWLLTSQMTNPFNMNISVLCCLNMFIALMAVDSLRLITHNFSIKILTTVFKTHRDTMWWDGVEETIGGTYLHASTAFFILSRPLVPHPRLIPWTTVSMRLSWPV